MSAFVSYIVEGKLDDAVALRLFQENAIYCEVGQLGFSGPLRKKDEGRVEKLQGRAVMLRQQSGKSRVKEVASIVNPLCKSNNQKWVAIIDLDQDYLCPGEARGRWLPNPAPYMCFRIAVREVEAWLLADRVRMAAFLQIDVAEIPMQPELVPDPKQELLRLASKSKDEGIRSDLVKISGEGLMEGAAYSERLRTYVRGKSWWRPAAAAQNTPSLKKCIERLQQLAKGQPVN